MSSLFALIAYRLYSVAVLLLPTKVLAAVFSGPGLKGGAGDAASIGLPSTDIKGFIGTVANFVLEFIATLAVLYIIIAGARLIISNGEEGEKDKAKKGIMYAVVGLIVIALAAAIVNLTLNLIK